jgi:hypothetical protein
MAYILRELDLNPICRYNFFIWLVIVNKSDDSLTEKPKLITQRFGSCVVKDISNIYTTNSTLLDLARNTGL